MMVDLSNEWGKYPGNTKDLAKDSGVSVGRLNEFAMRRLARVPDIFADAIRRDITEAAVVAGLTEMIEGDSG